MKYGMKHCLAKTHIHHLDRTLSLWAAYGPSTFPHILHCSSFLHRRPIPLAQKEPQNIFLGSWFGLCSIWPGLTGFPLLLLTYCVLRPWTSKWFLSEKSTFDQSSAVQFPYCLAQSGRCFFILSVNSCFFIGFLATLPFSSRHFRTVESHTDTLLPINLCSIPDCFFGCFTLSCRAMVSFKSFRIAVFKRVMWHTRPYL